MLTNSLHSSWRYVMALSRLADGEKVIFLGAQSGRNQYKPAALQVAQRFMTVDVSLFVYVSFLYTEHRRAGGPA